MKFQFMIKSLLITIMSNIKVLFTKRIIKSKVKSLGKKIAKDFKGEHVVLVCVLNGAYLFASDLSRVLWEAGHENFEMEFVRISSYGKSKKSSGKPKMTKDVETDLKGKSIVIVEDIVETGYTLNFLVSHLKKSKPKTVRICALLSKPLRKVKIEPDYLGFEVKPSDWVEGYGLDTGNLGRARSDIIVR